MEEALGVGVEEADGHAPAPSSVWRHQSTDRGWVEEADGAGLLSADADLSLPRGEPRVELLRPQAALAGQPREVIQWARDKGLGVLAAPILHNQSQRFPNDDAV